MMDHTIFIYTVFGFVIGLIVAIITLIAISFKIALKPTDQPELIQESTSNPDKEFLLDDQRYHQRGGELHALIDCNRQIVEDFTRVKQAKAQRDLKKPISRRRAHRYGRHGSEE